MVRKDLSAGDQAAQAAHAAFYFGQEHPSVCAAWHRDSQYLVLLAASDEEALRTLLQRATDQAIPVSEYYEPDLENSLTAIALAPSAETRRLCANLPLALREVSLA